ncbi:glutathione synthetase-like [Ptychodera flava]|uniref:glutathione synthetase-like n=1 Tax=Ptychodera flava TaxID=63121 RepID=UPI003969D4FB
MESCTALPINDDVLEDIVSQSKDFANVHGIVMRRRESPTSSELVCFTPHTLLPSPVPRKLFEEALGVQGDFNLLVHGVSRDHGFLKEAMQDIIKEDDFNRRLFDIYEDVYIKNSPAQTITLDMLRSDYMFDSIDDKQNEVSDVKLRQIEINTFASGLAGLGSQATHIHRFNLENLGLSDKAAKLPDSRAVDNMAEGFVEAWRLYGNERAAIAFFIEEVSWNITDQRWLEYKIRSINKSIPIIRRTSNDFVERAKLDHNRLIIDKYEVAIVYYRYGHDPGQYKTEKAWEARLMIEKSLAIKCPSVMSHLAGSKKVQQELSRPGALERFQKYFPDSAGSVQRIRNTFAGLYALTMDKDGDAFVQEAMARPDKYVLKPQREGGGNNLFDGDVLSKLQEIGQDSRRAFYIMMDRIMPLVVKNYPIQSGRPLELKEMVSELGIFGAIISKGEEVLYNKTCGHILRTKLKSALEGSFAYGTAVIDSPYLV